MRAVFVKAHDKFKVGDQVELQAADFAVLAEQGLTVTATEWEANERAVKAAEREEQGRVSRIEAAVVKATAEGRFLPKEDVSEVKANAIIMERSKSGTGEAYVMSFPIKAELQDKGDRKTTTVDPEKKESGVELVEAGLRETIKGYIHASEPFTKTVRQGGIVRAIGRDNAKGLQEIIECSMTRSRMAAKLGDMVAKGADFSRKDAEMIVRAGDYADPASNNPLGVLNTGLVLQWNLGFLANQLALLQDIVTDVSGAPVLFNQNVVTRYSLIPKVMLKTTSNAWPVNGAPTGTDVDVQVKMDTHAGVPLSISNNILAATPRQLFNEQRQPQLYSLGEYIVYKLIYAAMNGVTRIANDGTSTSTVAFDNASGPFSVTGATLATFTADLPAAMDESKMPGGDEDPGDSMLQRWAWVQTRVYANAAGDTNFLLNQSIWGANAKTGENLIETGRYSRIGNVRFRKSQMVSDATSAAGTGADATSNGIVVTAGSYADSTKVGLAGTRNALLFVSRVPLDYTKVLPDVPATAAIELVSEPRTGLTFMVVKFLDHSYETANMRVQLMFGVSIGDERQGMYLTK